MKPAVPETGDVTEKVADAPAVSPPARAAGGLTAVATALRRAATEVGAIEGPRLLLRSNQLDGFDCPGCAWPDPLGERKTFEFCENGAKAVADEATRRRVTREFFARWPVSKLAVQTDRWLNEQGRLTEPMWLPPGATHYQPVGWDEAFGLMRDQLESLGTPDAAAFYTSGRTSNEAAFLYQLFVRRLGTNNLPDCSNLCHESSGVALTEVLGSGKGTVTLDDFEKADAIFVIGQNPGSNHPRMLATLQAARRRGATIVSVNPLEEAGVRRFRNPQQISGILGPGTPLAGLTLRVRVNGDVPLFKGLNKCLLEAERAGRPALDHEFIRAHTHGFEAYRDALLALDWPAIEAAAGVCAADIRRAAEIAIAAPRIICCWAMGITQHRNAVANIQEIVNFLLLRGSIGKPGAGACPVRGHSNVQGDRTMGIWERPRPEFLDALRAEFGFEPPRDAGLDTVGTIQAMAAGRIRFFMAMGGNFARATPDLEFTRAALARCALTVQVSTKLNLSHAVTGHSALILPALGRTELDLQQGVPQWVTVEDSMGAVRRSQGRRPPASPQLKSEVRIVADLGRRVFGDRDPVDWGALADDYHAVRERIARVIPGFSNFNARIAAAGEFLLPHAVRDERRFHTATGKAQFTCTPLEPVAVPEGCFLMTTLRSHDQFNTTVYSDDDRYRGIHNGRRVVFMHPEDAREAGLATGDLVDVHSEYAGETRVVRGFRIVNYDVPRGCVGAYYPETNALIPIHSVAVGSNTPAYKSVVVRLLPHSTTARPASGHDGTV